MSYSSYHDSRGHSSRTNRDSRDRETKRYRYDDRYNNQDDMRSYNNNDKDSSNQLKDRRVNSRSNERSDRRYDFTRDDDREYSLKSVERHPQHAQRSGIGLNSSAWEAPQRLSSVNPSQSKTFASTTSADKTDSESLTLASHSEWEMPTPLRSTDDNISSQQSNLSTYSSKTTITNRALRKAGFLMKNDDSNNNKTNDNCIFNEPSPLKSPNNINEDDDDFDREFYLSEEGQIAVEGDRASSAFLGNPLKFKEKEDRLKKSRLQGQAKFAGMSAKRSQLHVDQEAWEDNRLIQSGVAVMKEQQMHFEDDEESRVQLLVHTTKPPFLDGRISFSMVQTTVSTVRDPTSDMAINARNGSNLLKDVREKREMMKMRKRFWELGGSKMGNTIGVEAPVEEKEDGPQAKQVSGVNANIQNQENQPSHVKNSDDVVDDDQVNYKDSTSFAKHMKGMKNEARSHFSQTKSIKQQREFLPVYSVRSSLLDVIRENQIVIVVGETGSGRFYNDFHYI